VVSNSTRLGVLKDGIVDASERRTFKEGLLLEGQQDFIALWEVHNGFSGEDPADSPPLHEVQEDTVHFIRELVNEGLFVLGYPNRKDPTGFTQFSLEEAMAEIDKSYIDNFDYREGWTNIVWLTLTDEGKKVAQELRRAREVGPEASDASQETSEHDEVREGLLMEGVIDAISLGEVHTTYRYDNHTPKRPLHDAQQLTLNMIREVVSDGLFVLGVPNPKSPSRFDQWDLPLDTAMAKIEEAYVNNFEDRWGWATFVWLNATAKGEELGRQLHEQNGPWP
jgi:hypothetical protein